MAQDFYDILGVNRSASDDEIRTAYRSAARKLHPDVNKAPDAAQKFGQMQKAYEVLSDREKRSLYDRFGEAGLEAGVGAPPPGQGARGRAGPRARQAGINIDGMDFDPDDLSSIFESIFAGDPAARSTGPFNAAGARGRRPRGPIELEEDLDVDFMTCAKGGKKSIRISAGGKSREVEVKVPAGVEEGAVLRLQGPLGPSGEPAQLLLTVHVARHPLFVRGSPDAPGKGLDLTVEVPVTIAESTLGASVSVPTLGGSAEIRIPPDSASGRRLRLKGQGIKDAEGRIGDLYAVVRVVPPPSALLSDAEKELLRQLSGKTPSPRQGPEWTGGG